MLVTLLVTLAALLAACSSEEVPERDRTSATPGVSPPATTPGTADKLLRRHGFRPVARPETFWVTGTFGPLRDGEVDRARRWGEQLAAAAAGAGQGAGV